MQLADWLAYHAGVVGPTRLHIIDHQEGEPRKEVLSQGDLFFNPLDLARARARSRLRHRPREGPAHRAPSPRGGAPAEPRVRGVCSNINARIILEGTVAISRNGTEVAALSSAVRRAGSSASCAIPFPSSIDGT